MEYRIVVRDKKGVETVRRSSHLKACALKDKVTAMLLDRDKYSQFGRNTKLLLHPKDVPDLQFTSKTEEKGKIPPEAEVSMVNVMSKKKGVSGVDLVEKGGKISPQLQKSVEITVVNSSSEYIVDYMDDLKKHSEIPQEAAAKEETDKLYEQ